MHEKVPESLESAAWLFGRKYFQRVHNTEVISETPFTADAIDDFPYLETIVIPGWIASCVSEVIPDERLDRVDNDAFGRATFWLK